MSTDTRAYEARIIWTVPASEGVPAAHHMSLSLFSRAETDWVAAATVLSGCPHEVVEYWNGADETGAPPDFDHDFHLWKANACPVCGRPLNHDSVPSMLGYGHDTATWCNNGCAVTACSGCGAWLPGTGLNPCGGCEPPDLELRDALDAEAEAHYNKEAK